MTANPLQTTRNTELLTTPSNDVKHDVIAGFLVFLIALPLCLGISHASGFPPINGVFTAIAGGIICGFISNSALTIKGPAAGMIAIVLGAATEFAAMAGVSADNSDPSIFMMYLPSVAGVAVVAGLFQIVLGLWRAGALADFFPTAVIHGLLASIGLIIIGKQIYPLLGLKPNLSLEAYEAYAELPLHAPHFAWQVAMIGGLSLLLLFAYPYWKKRFYICNLVPAQLLVLALSIPSSAMLYSGFADMQRSYQIVDSRLLNNTVPVAQTGTDQTGKNASSNTTQHVKSLLVKVPPHASTLPSSFIFPSFQYIGTFPFWKWVMMFSVVGSLESLLSAKAVDVLDPMKRKTDLNRDLLAVGIANTSVALIGGLPMISEIVRSGANKDYGARSRWANFFHGIFLLLCVCLIPFLVNKIPLAALAAMLIYAGCRLANFKEFLHMWHIGKEQLTVFVATIAGVLATDLLVGVGIGILTELALLLLSGVNPLHLARVSTTTEDLGHARIVRVESSVVFTNWLSLKKKLLGHPQECQIVVDCTRAQYLDHTTMLRLHELKYDFERSGRVFTLRGLEQHTPVTSSELSARKLIAEVR